jgi:hypothetical protein
MFQKKGDNAHTVNQSRTYTTFCGSDNVTYQIMAYRELKADEAMKKVIVYLKNAAPQKRPLSGDVVIMDTAIGLRRN